MPPSRPVCRTSSSFLCAAAVLFLASGAATPQSARLRSTVPGIAPARTQSGLTASPEKIEFGTVPVGSSASLTLTLTNTGPDLELERVRFLPGACGDSSAFALVLPGARHAGAAGEVVHELAPLRLARGQELVAAVEFAPTSKRRDDCVLRFEGDSVALDVPVGERTGPGVLKRKVPAEEPERGLVLPDERPGERWEDPFLHVVIDGPTWLIDHDGDGRERLVLDGTGSHTHEPGRSLQAFRWSISGLVLATGPILDTRLSPPEKEIKLEIRDDGVPPRSLTGSTRVRVVPPSRVPGVLASYNDASAGGAELPLEHPPATADFLEQRPNFLVNGAGRVGGSPFSGDVLVRLAGSLHIAAPGVYTLNASGGAARRLFCDGAPVTGPLLLEPGPHALEARFVVDALADLPLDVQLGQGSVLASIDGARLTHDVSAIAPVVNEMTEIGVAAGGTPVTLEGLGFFPPEAVVIHWGSVDLVASDFTSLTPTRIELRSPPGGGAVAVTVENGKGTSGPRTFLYQQSGPAPVLFRRDLMVSVPAPTAGVWAPDGKLYVASLDGRISALEFDERYELVSQEIFAGVSRLANHDTLGLAVNPYDPPAPVRLYVAHGDHFVNGGASPTGPSPYTGQVSVLTGPDFDAPEALITGLPVSNHDHAVNGIVFDDNGDLLISVGSMTNAGVRDPESGDLPESPLSAAVLKAHLSRPDFDGTITYVETASGIPNDDQRSGELVDVAGTSNVEVHASGLRNAFGLVYTTKGKLYATDNGPNIGFGAASTGPTTQGSDPYDDDEIDLVEWGNYYGSPNRNRGRRDPRQSVYQAGLRGPSSSASFTQMIGWSPPSSDGIDEYRADTFGGEMRGNLVVQEYLNRLRRVRLRPDGRGLLGQSALDPLTSGLGCATGPGGAILSFDFEGDRVHVLEADDRTALELVVHDVFPWRAPAAGGAPFVIAGRGFGTLASTSVTIGGQPATLTSVSWGRIRGLVPAFPAASTGLLDVVVTVGGEADTLPAAFRALAGAGREPGRWEALASLSVPLGEVAAGVVDGTLYLVGEGHCCTQTYDLINRQWRSASAPRPFVGHHHAAEVLGGKLYLVGGLGGGSEGKLQVFDPLINTWSTGAPLPWGGGSVSTAVIGDKLYAAGGIVGTFTVNNCAVYDPQTNAWTTRAAMPDGGRNHTAAATDGTRLFVFGGRRGGNFVSNGYDSVLVYSPATNSWAWSGAPNATLATLPEARGGMGKAVYLRGEFYVFGGETLSDPDAWGSGVYARVDVYDPRTNSWRREADMPNPRHGIFPVLFQGHVFLAGGGTQSGNSQSSLFDTFRRQ